MSYAGVESDREYYERTDREAAANAARYWRERDPAFIAEKAKKERADKLASATHQLAYHRQKVAELRTEVRRLERACKKGGN